MAKVSAPEQIELYCQADSVVALHRNGLTNLTSRLNAVSSLTCSRPVQTSLVRDPP
jgi:hypothetical protein